jgi:DUF1680 family protein
LVIDRKWKGNTSLILEVKMPVHFVKSNPKIEADYGKIAIERGPLVYCAEEVDNFKGILEAGITSHQKLHYEFDPDLLTGIGVLEGKVLKTGEEKPSHFKAIPYFAWSHRGVGQMVVWMNVKVFVGTD